MKAWFKKDEGFYGDKYEKPTPIEGVPHRLFQVEERPDKARSRNQVKPTGTDMRGNEAELQNTA